MDAELKNNVWCVHASGAFEKLWKTHIFGGGRLRCQSVAGCAPTGQVEPRLIDYVSQASLLQ